MFSEEDLEEVAALMMHEAFTNRREVHSPQSYLGRIHDDIGTEQVEGRKFLNPRSEALQ